MLFLLHVSSGPDTENSLSRLSGKAVQSFFSGTMDLA